MDAYRVNHSAEKKLDLNNKLAKLSDSPKVPLEQLILVDDVSTVLVHYIAYQEAWRAALSREAEHESAESSRCGRTVSSAVCRDSQACRCRVGEDHIL